MQNGVTGNNSYANGTLEAYTHMIYVKLTIIISASNYLKINDNCSRNKRYIFLVCMLMVTNNGLERFKSRVSFSKKWLPSYVWTRRLTIT